MKSTFLALALCATALAPRPALAAPPAASPLEGVLVENGRSLFYQVPAGSLKAARKSFVVRVGLDGRPVAEETFHLKNAETAPTVELFALSSRLRDQIFDKANRPEHFVTVTVLLDGRAVTELSWDDFVRSSLQLRNDGSFHPVVVASEVKSFDSPRAVKPGGRGPRPLPTKGGVYPEPYCADSCQTSLDSCLEWCDPRGDSCTQCYTWYNDCYTQCPMICEDPKEVKVYVTQTSAGSHYTGVGGCYRSLFGGNFMYAELQATIKNTQYRKTTYCNGTSTTEELSYWYTYASCFQKGQSCPIPYSGTMYQSCSN